MPILVLQTIIIFVIIKLFFFLLCMQKLERNIKNAWDGLYSGANNNNNNKRKEFKKKSVS